MQARQGNGQGQVNPPPGFEGKENSLEGHLRGLIVNNSAPGASNQPGPEAKLAQLSLHESGRGSVSSPGPAGLSADGQFDVAAQMNPSPQSQAPSERPSAQPTQPPSSPKASRKRPNQAQRRQMNAQLTVPIDPRPQVPDQSAHDTTNYRQRGSRQNFQNGQASATGPWARSHQTQSSNHFHPQQGGGPGFVRHHGPGRSMPNGPPSVHPDAGAYRAPRSLHGTSFQPQPQSQFPSQGGGQARPDEMAAQSAFLEDVCLKLVAGAEIERDEIIEKESFRGRLEHICREVITQYEMQHNGRSDFIPPSVALKSFGSLASGFATKASDLDLGLVSPLSDPQPDAPDSPIPRLVEKAFLDNGFGARLLTRTRVPIIKICEIPPNALLADLREARDKWEKGIDHENDHDHDLDVIGEAAEGDDPAASETKRQKTSSNETHEVRGDTQSPSTPSAALFNAGPATHGEDAEKTLPGHLYLRQTESQSLPAYHNNAKRVLRKLDGRDITLSNSADLTRSDCETLLRVCKAFVEGLHDQALKRRLQTYRSMSFNPPAGAHGWRSLLGVYTQVEGEHIVMLWENRAIRERLADRERLAEELVVQWKGIQNEPGHDADPLVLTKQLQIALDKIKKFASVQLLTLEQSQFEPASDYMDRTMKIVAGLKPSDHLDVASFQQLVVKHYVAGIWSHEIKADVEAFISSCAEPPSLMSVARRHKTLQLSVELQRALDKKLFEKDLEDPVKEYSELLRGPLDRPAGQLEYTLPRPPSHILSVIQNLRDPSKMAPNQPRDRYRDKLEFPKTGAGVQCDINFSAHLALHNTAMLRCYAHTDPRVRPLVLFVKHWAKMRDINTPYRGSLSSYGYVLMMLHYLVNVAQPFVCPNLQALGPPPPSAADLAAASSAPILQDNAVFCRGRFVGFWRDEPEIQRLASMGQLNGNRDSVGRLLRGFFEYYAQMGHMSTFPGVRGFDWGRDVLSLRTPGGLLSKQAKGWTGAKTVVEYRTNNNPSAQPSAQSHPHSRTHSQSDGQAYTAAIASPTDPAPPAATQHASTEAVPGIPATLTDPVAGQSSGKDSAGHPPPGTEVKEVRHRYLFAIEDPFELDHNVARTVTHNGIVSIRDEFRRAWRIIKSAGRMKPQGHGQVPEDLLLDVNAAREENSTGDFKRLLADIHGFSE